MFGRNQVRSALYRYQYDQKSKLLFFNFINQAMVIFYFILTENHEIKLDVILDFIPLLFLLNLKKNKHLSFLVIIKYFIFFIHNIQLKFQKIISSEVRNHGNRLKSLKNFDSRSKKFHALRTH